MEGGGFLTFDCGRSFGMENAALIELNTVHCIRVIF